MVLNRLSSLRIVYWVCLLAYGLIVASTAFAATPDTCGKCSRSAYVSEVLNLHNPDWDAGEAAWERCMRRQIPGLSEDADLDWFRLKTDGDLFKQAEKHCATHQYAIPKDVMSKESVEARIAEVITSSCFHLALDPNRAEYRIEATFEAGLSDAGQDNQGRNITSEFRILLFHDETNELVKSWETRGHNNLIALHYNRMFNNDNAVLRQDRNIGPYLREYEKMPAKASFIPDCKVALPGNELTLKLQNIIDGEGDASREFNRVLLCATEGKITNGSEWSSGPDCRVFRVGTGSLQIEYKASDHCDVTDTIRVYSSCDILPPDKLPLTHTTIGEVIAEGEVKTICDLTGSVLEDRLRIGSVDTRYAEREADFPLQVNSENDPLTVYGNDPTVIYRYHGECTTTNQYSADIEGDFVCEKGENPKLRLMKHTHQPKQKNCCSHGRHGRSCSVIAYDFDYDGWGGFNYPCHGTNADFDEQGNVLLPVRNGSSIHCSGIGDASLTLRLKGSDSQ